MDADLVVVINLGKTGRHLSGTRTGTGNHDERLGGFDAGICAVPFVRDNTVNIGRIALGRSMTINPDTPVFQLGLEGLGCRLIFPARNDDESH